MSVRLFVGYDEREAAGFHAFIDRLVKTSPDVWVRAIGGQQGDGTNAFTYERFKIPERCGWSGWALFVDGADMLPRTDIAELWALRDERYAVQVVKHDYKTKHSTKYVGTEMECANADYPRKNWSSVVLWNCGHKAHFEARAKLRAGTDGPYLHRFGWLKDEEIGSLPVEWNWLADEYGENEKAKLLHWTAGIPGFYAYKDAPHSDEWRDAVRKMTRGLDGNERHV